MINRVSLFNFLVILIIVSLSVSPSFLLGEGDRNLFLISILFICPILLIFFGRIRSLEISLIIFIFSIIFLPALYQPERLRVSSILYSLLFCSLILTYKSIIFQFNFKIENYLKTIKFIILAYFIVLLIQQFCVLSGLPIFMSNNYEIISPWKLNSLSAEPSHSGRIIPFLMYCYVINKQKFISFSTNILDDIKNDKLVWFAFLWPIFTMGSGSGILFFILLLFKFLKFRDFLTFLFSLIFLFVIFSYFQINSAQRAYDYLLAFITLDEYQMLITDHSAAMRIVPIIVVFKKLGLSTLNDWLGYGIDYSSTFLSNEVPGLPEGSVGGGLFQIWLEYGFISFISFSIFSFFTAFNKNDLFTLFFWLLLVFLYGVNNQIVWLCLILLFTNKYFEYKFIKK